jgi:Zn finger protein HypA/HybF involved in hydrogenase expression
MRRSNTKEFIQKAHIIQGGKYDYSKTDYINTYSKVTITCPIHGDFFQTPHDHLNGYGCRKCRSDNLSKLYRHTKTKFIEKAIKIHGNKFEYGKVIYENNNIPIIITCKLHGNFYQLPGNHLKGNGCPKCKSSKGEIQISNFLKCRKIKYYIQQTFNGCINPKTNYKLRYDFYIPSKNLLIEYDGKQHFTHGGFINGKHKIIKKDVEYLKYKDKIKSEFAKQKGMKLLRIKYTQFKEIENILKTL